VGKIENGVLKYQTKRNGAQARRINFLEEELAYWEDSYEVAVKLLEEEVKSNNELTDDITRLLDKIAFMEAREKHLLNEVDYLTKQVADSKTHIDNLNKGMDALDDILTAQERDNQTLRELLSVEITAEIERDDRA